MSDLGASGGDFGSFGGGFLVDLGSIWDGFGTICCTLSVFFVGKRFDAKKCATSVPKVFFQDTIF